ncbi:hypothetical protein C8R43DRAFT_1118641 [Mycena crocata]|nr:hypothetical protein C8R43DRAFT_1118641 [Mycena crocata]
MPRRAQAAAPAPSPSRIPLLLPPLQLRGSAPRPLSRSHQRRHTERTDAIVVLTCGAEIAPDPMDPTPWGSSEKWVVPMLPLPLGESRTSPSPTERPSTGCGSTIHASASQRGLKTWIGASDAAGRTVIPLPAEYFTDDQRSQLGGGPKNESCGCVIIGVGCCICGNTLGVHKTLCTAHHAMRTISRRTYYIFLADSVSPPLVRKRKAPIVVIDRPRTDSFAFANWLAQSRRREPSPSRRELGEMTRRLNEQSSREEAALEAGFAQVRALNVPLEPARIVFGGDSSMQDEFALTLGPSSARTARARAEDPMSDEEIVAWTLQNSNRRSDTMGRDREADFNVLWVAFDR